MMVRQYQSPITAADTASHHPKNTHQTIFINPVPRIL